MAKQCEFVETGRTYFWGKDIVDPTEPDFVPGKGIPLPDYDLPCRNVADDGEKYCPKHKMLVGVSGEASQ
ncbi:MAG TPA: hypothetical protein VFA74_05675 [Terriglobales bacterium]|nr:hypothetical protein [Terriglobales bacterium]